MKILSCYIAGFGKFSNRSFDFSSDLVMIQEENGWGKSTLADFLKCMLYGMDNGRSKSVSANDRLKYAPWRGGAFGGALTFSVNGRTYRVERSFGKTPSGDSVRVFDGNNMPTDVFGRNGEILGETLFGVDKESYQRTVYVSQGGIDLRGMPDDMKSRLLTLLGGGETGGNGAEVALEKLDNAERALRAKRRPAKGKLDEIDERLAYVSRQKAEDMQLQTEVASAEERIVALNEEIAVCEKRLGEVSANLEKFSRGQEMETKRGFFRETQAQLLRLDGELSELSAFFGNVDPLKVNIVGLEKSVTEFYALQKELSEIEKELRESETALREKEGLEAQYKASEKAMISYELLLEKNEGRGRAGTRRNKKKVRYIETKHKASPIRLFVWMFLAIFGATQTTVSPVVGYVLFGVGCLGLVVSFFKLLPRKLVEKTKEDFEKKEDLDEVDEDLIMQYDEARAQTAGLRRRLQEMSPHLSEITQNLRAEYEEKRARANGLENGIVKFLQNFRFGELYDYRVAVTTIKDGVERYRKICGQKAEIAQRSDALGAEVRSFGETPLEDWSTVKNQRTDLERRKEHLFSERARLSAQTEEMRLRLNRETLLAEEETLTKEKDRLEHKLYVIRAAREMLLRAKENMATRYLQPVQEKAKMRLQALQANSSDLRFSAEGESLLEESGQLRGVEYYSAGEKELVDFCIRLGLIDTVFLKERPPLILDDPFVNLDDKRAEKAKKLVKDLAGEYQILYFTCAADRRI